MEITVVKSKLGDRPRYRVYDHAITEDQVDKNTRVEFNWIRACASIVRIMLKGEPCTLKIVEATKEIPDPDSIVNKAKNEVKNEKTVESK